MTATNLDISPSNYLLRIGAAVTISALLGVAFVQYGDIWDEPLFSPHLASAGTAIALPSESGELPAQRSPLSATALEPGLAKSSAATSAAFSHGAPPLPEDLNLATLIDSARDILRRLNAIPDYTATLVSRERLGDSLRAGRLALKIRHEPFSIYVRQLSPAKLKGTECIYVEGQNDGKMLAHSTGFKHRLLGTLALRPTSELAMSECRYPITEVGLHRLLERMINVGERELPLGNCEVTVCPTLEIEGRMCEGLQIVHSKRSEDFLYHIVRLYVDPQNGFPVRFESYDWPETADGEPPLLEEYTYEDLNFGVGLTDLDFSADNPNYAFRRR